MVAAAQSSDVVNGQLAIDGTIARRGPASANGELNRLSPEDRPVHQWYRFVLSYPPHLVRTYLEHFGLTAGLRRHAAIVTGATLRTLKQLAVRP